MQCCSADIDIGKTWVDGLVEVSKGEMSPPTLFNNCVGPEVHQRGWSHTLLHIAEWESAARNCTQTSNTCAQAMNHGSVHAMRKIMDAHVLHI